MRAALAGVLLLATAATASSCSADPAEGYCAAVKDHQAELGELVGEGEPDALLRALPAFRELQDEAPGDVADEWQQLVGRVEALEEALRTAGVDPATYDRAQPPAGLQEDERARIDAAARELAAPATAEAVAALEQQARDVCKTPLVL